MNSVIISRQATPARLLLLIAVVISGLTIQGVAADEAEMEKLFRAATGKKEDTKARDKLIAMGDETVDFLCGLIRDQKKHEIEITSVNGRERIMISWGQDAGSMLMSIDTPKVVTELRKLALHDNDEVRCWGISTLRSCDTQRMENFAFFRSRLEVETAPRCLEELVGILAHRLDPADVPVFKKVAEKSRDLHLKLALWHALGMQGDRDAAMEILKVCETETGHLGFNYMRDLSGRELESKADWKACRKWLETISADDYRKLAERRRPLPLPAPLPGRPAYPLPQDTPAEIKEALAWFDSLGFPSVKGLARVQVIDEYSSSETKDRNETRIGGWLLEEKEGRWRILTGADAGGPFSWDGTGAWPMREWVVQEHDRTENGWRSVRRVEKVDFKKEVEAMLAGLESKEGASDDRFGMVLSRRAAVFLAGRDCMELGHTETGLKLLQRAPSLWRDVSEIRSLGQMLADEFAQCALWGITLDFGVPTISREALLARLEAALRQFPASRDTERMKAMADRLRSMIAVDKTHDAAARPFDQMTPEEQAAELVFQLRDQNGTQESQPGWCDIFQGPDGSEDESSPAAKLVKLGHAAVPALMAALGTEDYSRSVGFWRDFRFSHTVLTTGDCALQTLERIAGRRFFEPKTTSSYMSKDDKVKATRADVEKWWAAEKDKPEKKEKSR